MTDEPTEAPLQDSPVDAPAHAQATPEFEFGSARESLDALVRHSGDCVKLIDLDGRVLKWNSACEDLYGWRSSDVVHRVLPHIAPEKRLRAIYDIRDAAASEAISERETTAVRSDGSHLALRSTLIPVRDAEGNPSAVLSVTRWVPGGLSAGGRQDDFATLVAKQLRDPLASISGFTQLLQRPEILDDPVRRERTVKALAERAKYVSSLLDDLQLVAEIEEGRFELSKETTELGLLVTEAAEHVDPKGTRILVDFDPNLAPVSVDQNRVAQAVTRLVENAVRYSPETASVEVSVFGADDYVVIEVSDSGSDVDPVEGSEVFERSYFGAPGAPRALGLGVGLYLVRMITEAHGGAVLFKSEPGAGNTFSIRLPRTADGS